MAASKDDLVSYARSLGFDRVGITSAEAIPEAAAYLESWLEQGRAGNMDYLGKNSARRSAPEQLLPGAKSVIALAVNYFPGDAEGERGREFPECKVARYAGGKDYHKVLGKRLDSLIRYLQAMAPEATFKPFVDTGPLLERPFAQRAGLGFIGKNTMLITRGLGSWVFLAHIVSTLELPLDAPDTRSCGTCRLCIDACPTEAITEPFQLDPRRCISYLTIESDGVMDTSLRSRTNGWVFGCDICQDVCPHNTRIPRTTIPEFFPPETPISLRLNDLLRLRSDEEFRRRFHGTALMRAGRESLVRNACVAAGVLGRKDLLPLLADLNRPPEGPIVREHAQWAIKELAEPQDNRRSARGFSLIELMVTIAILGILAAIAIPQYIDMVAKSKEATVKGQIGTLRSAIAIYYGDNEGEFPPPSATQSSLKDALTTGAKYLAVIPTIALPSNRMGNPGHGPTNSEDDTPQAACPPDVTELPSQIWYYDPSSNDCRGQLFIHCQHSDVKGSLWSSF